MMDKGAMIVNLLLWGSVFLAGVIAFCGRNKEW